MLNLNVDQLRDAHSDNWAHLEKIIGFEFALETRIVTLIIMK